MEKPTLTKTLRFLLVLGVLLGVECAALVAPPLVDAVVNYKSIAVGKLMRATDAQGWVSWPKTLYHQGFSKNGTGGILDFNHVKLGATGYVMPRLGFCSDTLGSNVTVFQITQNDMRYRTSAAGTQRIWCPDKGEPYEVVGDSGWSWDSVNQVVTVSTGGADTVTVTWYGVMSGAVYSGAKMISELLAIVLVVTIWTAFRNPDYRDEMLRFALIIGILGFFAWWLSSMGF